MNTLNLTQGFTDNEQYKAWKFDGGEVHFQLKNPPEVREIWEITARVNSSDDLMLLILAIDTLHKDVAARIEVFLPYMPYAQADRDFAVGESFSLETVCRILKGLPVNKWTLFDAHSDVAPALLNAKRVDNSAFVTWVMRQIQGNVSNLTWLSPDAGAYKKIGKLADVVGWKGDVAAANKYRNTSSGEIEKVQLSTEDFGGKDILIIDDICMGGRTFIGLQEKLRNKNAGKIYLAISHMINLHVNPKLLESFNGVFTTNSRHDRYYGHTNFESTKVQVYNII